MEIELQKENEDGSADYFLKLNESEQADLIRFAFIEMLRRGIEEGKKHEPVSEPSVGNTTSGGVSCKDGTGEQSS